MIRPEWRFAAIPILASLAFSAATVGSQPHWQDSAIYLTAVKEFGVLYPHGFVLYLALCKAWTLIFAPLVGFTLSVHLFSSVCAALAAGVLALTAERITQDRAVSAVIGVLAAAGFTWWFSAILAKGYALYFLVVALLLWRMVCRDPVRTVLLLGIAWAAHPSAALLGPVVLAGLWHHRAEVRALGSRRLLFLASATVLCAVGPSLLLPAIAAREPDFMLGNPRTLREWFTYLTGSRFTTIEGVWQFDGDRWIRMVVFAWEEFLGIGAFLVILGLYLLARDRRRREVVFLLCWSVPIIVVGTMFRIEGQYDFWLVVAWMPLWLAAAIGLAFLRARAKWAPAAACLGGLVWAVSANGKDLYHRGYPLAETFGRCYLQNLDPRSVLVVQSDDAFGLTRYLQSVEGYRTDVRVIHVAHIAPAPSLRWHLDSMARRWPELRRPDFGSIAGRESIFSNEALAQASLVNGQSENSPLFFFDTQPASELLLSGSVVPAGFLWRWSPKPGARPEPRYWNYPLSIEQAAAPGGRKRGQRLSYGPGGVGAKAERYEDRLVMYLVEAGLNLVDLLQRDATRDALGRSVGICESILRAAPEYWHDPRVLYPMATGYYLLNRYGEAIPVIERVLKEDPSPAMRAGALFYLGEIRRAEGRETEARELYRQALEAAPPDSILRPELEKRLRPR